ncbi:hypothetical protein JZU68_00950, partial [bacterium]|nr:hypothetical protein [bacterium]
MCTLLISSIETTTAQGVKYDWMEDQPPTNKITRIQNNKFTTINTFPRRSIGSIKNGSLTAEQMACFDIICSKPYSIDKIMKAKEINPKLSYLRIYSPQAWQGANDEPDKQASGYPFNTSGSATANNQIFAGHFAYKAYTKTKSDLSNTENQILTVVDAERIAKGTFYYVIRPADSWDNAEHIKVTKSPEGVITVSERGYKSVAKSWPAGS